jgi:hypothetical protein
MPALVASTFVVPLGTPFKASGQQNLVEPVAVHSAAMSFSLTVAKSRQLQPAGQVRPPEQSMPLGKQMLVAGTASVRGMHVHPGCVHWLSVRQAVRTQVHAAGPASHTASLTVMPPSGDMLPDWEQVVRPGWQVRGAVQSVSRAHVCAMAGG